MQDLIDHLAKNQSKWLVTGAAGFIGSHLTEFLLSNNQLVVGLDNFATGFQANLDDVKSNLTDEQWSNLTFIEGDIRNFEDCKRACEGIDYVLHQAALGSVPRSIDDPLTSNEVNVSGFLNMLRAAEQAKVKRFVYASSSSVYGDSPALPKVEDQIGEPLSPYAVTKYTNEVYAKNFSRVYGIETIGLRYFNVFGPRQNPKGPYAAVIPIWVDSMLKGEACVINGDGSTSRDFCYVENVVQANVRAALTKGAGAVNTAYNIAVGDRTTLLELHQIIQKKLLETQKGMSALEPEFRDFRVGDVMHSHADIRKAVELLGYFPLTHVNQGIENSLQWYSKSSRLL